MNPMMVDLLNQVVDYVRQQDYKGAKDLVREVIDYFLNQDKLNMLIEVYGDDRVKETVAGMLNALEKEDMITLADMIEEVCIPGICDCISRMKYHQHKDYYLEQSKSGKWTVKYQPGGFYIHSQLDPMSEAKAMVEKSYRPDLDEYVVWGCGLLYHVYQLWKISDGTIRIRVFENDVNMIELGKLYGPFDSIPEEIEISHDDGNGFAYAIKDGHVGILMHMPSIKTIKNPTTKATIMRFFMAWNGGVQLKRLFDINFRVNMQTCKHNIVEQKKDFENQEVVIVAGGPSVDDNIEFLKKCIEKKRVIIAVNTIIKRLLDSGIIPDYMAVMDCHSRTYKHLEGVTLDKRVSMIVDSTAYWKFAKLHVGSSYIVLQEGYTSAEEYAYKNGFSLFDTGSSVTIMATDVALRLGSKKVFLIGADFAYRNGISHANGTAFQTEEREDNLFPVKGVTGENVYTTMALDEYRRQMEIKVSEFPETKVINCSRIGAHIEGTMELFPDNRGEL